MVYVPILKGPLVSFTSFSLFFFPVKKIRRVVITDIYVYGRFLAYLPPFFFRFRSFTLTFLFLISFNEYELEFLFCFFFAFLFL